jgi:phosphoribosylaminoimidazole-succinocarboxamide synthase
MIAAQQICALLSQAFDHSDLPLSVRRSGKVRDSYPLGDQRLLLVTTDRLSAFDRILGRVPYKGQVLNQLSAWWFEQTSEIIPNHMLDLPDPNALLAVESSPFAVEVVVRGYISGVTSTSLWYRYSLGERQIYGYQFPEGLRKNEHLPQPMITPTTKGGASGHDERLTCAEVVEHGLLDAETWDQVQAAALEIFRRGQALAQKTGLILVDTKYEFGRAPDGRVMLIDELHTPDSSRFWRADSYLTRFENGEEPENFDKEFLRLAYSSSGYRGEGEPPQLSDELWVAASQRYIAIFEMLTGTPFVPGDYPINPRLEENLRKAGLL